jgi:ABC-2 type transport system permease protein
MSMGSESSVTEPGKTPEVSERYLARKARSEGSGLSQKEAEPRLPKSLSAVFALIKVSLLEKLSYRHEMARDWLQMALEIVVFRQLWIALYAGRDEFSGVALAGALTYITMNTIVVRLFTRWTLMEVLDKIHSGDILIDLSRPLYFGSQILFHEIGQALVVFSTSSLPVFIIACGIFQLTLPTSGVVWLAFTASLILGFLTSFCLDYLLMLLGFWTTEVGGFFWAKDSVISVLGGTYLPLWIFPPVWKEIVSWLPFRGIAYTPLAIFIGQIGLDELPAAFAIQAAWLAILAWLSWRFYEAAMQKLAVQGG